MAPASPAEKSLIDRIRKGESDAWGDLIARYEGRLLAFVEGRVGRRAAAEDIVQETFVGFLTSLPNYDGKRPLESYLFSICAYKLTDHLRREGRRPAIAFFRPRRFPDALGGRLDGPRRQQHRAERRTPRLGGEVAGRGASSTRWTASATAAIGPSCSASNCCSSAAGPTRTSPRNWA